jgi:hypothetical protein
MENKGCKHTINGLNCGGINTRRTNLAPPPPAEQVIAHNLSNRAASARRAYRDCDGGEMRNFRIRYFFIKIFPAFLAAVQALDRPLLTKNKFINRMPPVILSKKAFRRENNKDKYRRGESPRYIILTKFPAPGGEKQSFDGLEQVSAA